VGVGHRVAHVHEAPQEPAQRKPPLAGVAPGLVRLVEALDGVVEGVALDEAHGVVGPAVGVRPQAVNRDDAGVLQAAGDLGLQQETRPAARVVGVRGLDLLEGHLAVQLLVVGHEDLPQAAPGVRPQHAEAGSRRRRVAQRRQASRIGVVLGLPCGGDQGQAGMQEGIVNHLKFLPHRPDRADRRQAPLGIVAVHFEVLLNHALQPGVEVRAQRPLLQEDLPQGLVLLQYPGVHGLDEGIARDEVHLQG
jgi:hypothetical protein